MRERYNAAAFLTVTTFGFYSLFIRAALARDSLQADFALFSALTVPFDTPALHSAALPMNSAAPSTPSAPIIIQGVTTQGRAFRPSDWAERLCGVLSTFGGDHQMRYSPHVRPVLLDGVRCVLVNAALAQIEPRAHRFLLDFAHDNELVVIDPTRPASDDFCPVPGSAFEALARSG
jgi:hypothetical protein